MRIADVSTSTATAARQAALLFAVCGALAVFAATVGGDRTTARALVGIADIGVAVVIAALPWSRWRLGTTLWLVGAALAVIATAHVVGLLPVRSYGVFFVLLFAWIGAHHPPTTALKLAPVITIGYVLPIMMTNQQPPLDLRAVIAVITVGVLVAETIARTASASERARVRADRSARTFATVGRATSTLVESDASSVLDTVVDTVMDLGYDGVNLAVIDPGTQTFTPGHARGLAAAFEGRQFSTTTGLTGRVAQVMAPVVIEDYQESEHSIGALRATGARTTIGVPVSSNGSLVAVLIATYARVEAVEPEDIEALRIVAAHAGAALGVLARLTDERQRSASHEHASLTDPLTGIGNRRRGQEFLDDLAFGDVVAIIDVDRFKEVNDTQGHATGDVLLTGLAAFLATSIRGRDQVVRWGGEEFLVILPNTTLDGALQLLERLRVGWEATAPDATFSAGAAAKHPDEAPATTASRADLALYQAKADGRNRIAG